MIYYDQTLKDNERCWNKKTRTKWHVKGDRNTQFSYIIGKIRLATKRISYLTIGDEVIIDTYEIVNQYVVHFNFIFNVDSNHYNNGLIDEVIPNIVDDQMSVILTSICTLI